jgi:hypothetical protein
MALNLFLAPGTVPDGDPLPGNLQALINVVAQYMGIDGADGFSGMNYGSDTPSPENRSYPWFKTDTDGNPIGLYSWNGSAWVAIPTIVASGPTGSRPLNPAVGTKYLDTTINVELMFNNGAWTTAAGSPGDIKFVNTDTIENALLVNPGWIQYGAASGRVIGAAGSGTGLTARAVGATVGEENHTLTINELPSHTHTTELANANADGNDYNTDQGLSGHNAPGPAGSSTPQSSAIGGDAAHNTMQPTIFLWCLQKQ